MEGSKLQWIIRNNVSSDVMNDGFVIAFFGSNLSAARSYSIREADSNSSSLTLLISLLNSNRCRGYTLGIYVDVKAEYVGKLSTLAHVPNALRIRRQICEFQAL